MHNLKDKENNFFLVCSTKIVYIINDEINWKLINLLTRNTFSKIIKSKVQYTNRYDIYRRINRIINKNNIRNRYPLHNKIEN